MAKKQPENTIKPREKALLIGVSIFGEENYLSMEDSLIELELLSETAGLNVVGEITQNLDSPNPKTFIGSGKVNEVRTLVGELKPEVLIFDNELSPRHQRELEKMFGDSVRVLDRTALILDIFAQHANTRDGSLQVELAQYEYRLPRLTRAWTHLARQAGGQGGQGGVGLRGPGETQLEVDRREINRRIDHLKRELEKVRAHRERHRSRRKQSRIPIIALVGYTNAGKSTLLNRLSESNVYVADQLFATLDPTTRRIELPGGNLALVTDTVGFIQKLPTQLIAAFRATLEEISEADLLLHVLDVTHLNVHAQAESVIKTLEEIGADHIPVLNVLNKIDLLERPESAKIALVEDPNSAAISATTGDGIDDLLNKVNQKLYENFEKILVRIPYEDGALLALFHDQGKVDRVEHQRKGVIIEGRLPGRLIARFQQYLYSVEEEIDLEMTDAE